MSAILKAARAAYAAGLAVLPVVEDGSKRPDVATWKSFQVVRPTIQQMRDLDFTHRAGLGVLAGSVSHCRECWDFDDLETYEAFVDTAVGCGLGDVVRRIMRDSRMPLQAADVGGS